MAENITEERKEQAMDLALLLYDIFQESQSDDNIVSGQNNANQTLND